MERYISSNGALIWTEAQGEAIKGTVLLASGGPGCCDYLSPVSEMLEDAYQVIRFEQRGCGRSTDDGNYDLQTVLQDMEAIRAAYKLDEWIICGHSWGADLAMIYALEHPERTSAVIFMAGIGVLNDRAWIEEYKANKEARGETHPPMDYSPNLEVNKQCNHGRKVYIQQPRLYANLAALCCPVLLLSGGEDIRPQWPVEQLHHLLPNSVFRFLPNAGHYAWLDEPEAVRRELREFFETI